jgi:hypothetical protein
MDNEHNVLLQAVAITMELQQPHILVGLSGGGKSTTYEDTLCPYLGLDYIDMYGHSMQPEDLQANVMTKEGVDILPTLYAQRIAKRTKKWALVVEEFTSLTEMMRPPMLRLFQEKKVGLGFQIDPNNLGTVVAICNPADRAENGMEISAPFSNRVAHFEWDLPAMECARGLRYLANDEPWPMFSDLKRLPENWKRERPATAELIGAFLVKFASEYYWAQPEEPGEAAKAWPSPRTWERTMNALAAAKTMGFGLGSMVAQSLLAAWVGEATAVAFVAYAKSLSFPAPEEVLKDPNLIPETNRIDVLYAILSGCVTHTKDSLTAKTWKALWGPMARVSTIGHTDIAASFLVEVIKMKPKDATIPADLVQPFTQIMIDSGLLKK